MFANVDTIRTNRNFTKNRAPKGLAKSYQVKTIHKKEEKNQTTTRTPSLPLFPFLVVTFCHTSTFCFAETI